MAQPPTPPTFKPFNIALIQLGGITHDKASNLKHAREMILKAATGEGGVKPKPDVIVLPVCNVNILPLRIAVLIWRFHRNASIRHTVMCISQYMQSRLHTPPASSMTSQRVRVRASKCSLLLPKRQERGSLEVKNAKSIFSQSLTQVTGSIPEKDITNGKLYNTCTVYSPQGTLAGMTSVQCRS